MISLVDQIGRTITLPAPPQRIVSLVPSLTELLFDLGLGDRIVGCTWFCVHPQSATAKLAKVGGTKNVSIDKMKGLAPDLVIASKEENLQTQVEEIEKFAATYVSDINTVAEAERAITHIGMLTGSEGGANYLLQRIAQNCNQWPYTGKSVAYLIWKDPFMAAAQDTFISQMLLRAGFRNALDATFSRYPEISQEELAALNADFIFLSSEPYPFQQKHAVEIAALAPHSKVVLVDGEIFSWYGSRLVKFDAYISSLLTSLSLK